VLARLGFALCLVGGVSVWLSACGGDDALPEPTLDYELFETTKLLDAPTLAVLDSVSDDQTMLAFSASTPLLDALAEGEVLLGAQTHARLPQGLLRRVTAIDRSGASVLVTTEPATVYHAFRRLDLDMQIPVDGLESPTLLPPPPPRGPGAVIAPLSISFPIGVTDVPLQLFDGDGLPTPEDRIDGTGTLRASVTLHFWLHFDWQSLSPTEALSALDDALDTLEDLAKTLTGDIPTLAELIHLETGIRVDGDFEAALALHGQSALHYDPDVPLGGYPLPGFWIGPLYFSPDISLVAHFDGGVTGSMDIGYGIGAHAGLGFQFAEGSTGPYVSGPTFTHQEPSATITAAAHLRAELELQLRLALYGFGGPYVSITAFSELDVERQRSPCYDLSAGLRGGTGASIGFAGQSIASIYGPSFAIGDPVHLASGDCAPLPDPPITDTLITPWSRSYEGTIYSTGTDDGFTNLELHHDGRLLLTSSGSDHLLKVNEDGTAAWARTLRQPDRADFPALWPEHAIAMSDTSILVPTHQGVLVELDAAGNALWGAELATDNLEPRFWDAKRVNDDVFLGGKYRVEGSDEEQAWLVVLDPDGYVKTSWTWGTPDHRELIRHILPLSDGALIVGEARQFVAGGTRSFVMRVDQNGAIVWAKDIESCADEEPVMATAMETENGKFIVGGWHYATETRAILFRLEPDGSDTAPAWATETTMTQILGMQPREIIQLETGELRVIGRWARTGGNDEIFIAATDSIGRFAWAKWYGGDRDQSPPTARITSQGGLLVAAGSSTVEPLPGGFWLFEVPVPNGTISFGPTSDATTGAIDFTSAATCLTLPSASTATTPLPIGLVSVGVESIVETPAMHTH